MTLVIARAGAYAQIEWSLVNLKATCRPSVAAQTTQYTICTE